MKDIFLYGNFYFINCKFNNYKYTDNRKGAPLNYLAYMKKGTAKIVSDKKTVNIKEGDVFYIPKNLGYQSYWYGEEIDFLSFGFSSLNVREHTKFELQTVLCNENIISKINNIPINTGNVGCRELSMFYEVMADIIPLLECDNAEKKLTEDIKKCIQDNPHASLSEVADMCLISEPYLYLIFKKNEKITPNTYRQTVLCKMGIELLETTDKKVEEIASVLNFSSSSYFRKILKKYTGCTPREIRKEKRI